jgi:transcriptional regulator of acetoin/glycerol metabolism
LSDGGALRLRDVRERVPTAAERVRNRPASLRSDSPPAEPHPSAERREQLVALFREHRGNVSKIATELGKPRAQVYRWLKSAGLDATELRTRKST